MGSATSKASRAAGATARHYPTRTPPTSSNAPLTRLPPAQAHRPGPTTRPQPHASGSRSEAINLDASDPDFAQSLRTIGPVKPNPTMSSTSSFGTSGGSNGPGIVPGRNGPDPRNNPALMVLDARQSLQDGAEKEFMEAGKRGHEGRQFLDVYTIRQMLTMRDLQGKNAAQIEKSLGLRSGSVARLGAKGVFGLAQEVGRADKVVEIV